uniref:NADP-dependent oxidoreductase domain-containing protein n=1 Tax=Parascaris univalens TaxID=6257 RepID=A0A915BSX7_PARUN
QVGRLYVLSALRTPICPQCSRRCEQCSAGWCVYAFSNCRWHSVWCVDVDSCCERRVGSYFLPVLCGGSISVLIYLLTSTEHFILLIRCRITNAYEITSPILSADLTFVEKLKK